MTQNQIAYHNARENERHNKMTEEELKRHQMVTESLQKEANMLQDRANQITQAHYERLDAESQRANRAREIENYRSDVVGESLKDAANRINAAMTAETSRHQKATELITQSLNDSIISRNLAEVSYTSANTGYIQARTGTEMFNQLSIQSDIATKSVQRDLMREQKKTEQSRQAQNYVGAGTTFLQGVGNAFRILAPIVM